MPTLRIVNNYTQKFRLRVSNDVLSLVMVNDNNMNETNKFYAIKHVETGNIITFDTHCSENYSEKYFYIDGDYSTPFFVGTKESLEHFIRRELEKSKVGDSPFVRDCGTDFEVVGITINY